MSMFKDETIERKPLYFVKTNVWKDCIKRNVDVIELNRWCIAAERRIRKYIDGCNIEENLFGGLVSLDIIYIKKKHGNVIQFYNNFVTKMFIF